ncbi:MAG: hypothetical protein AB1641_12970 [Thermodesulfobacteriota bacterium]
MSPEKVMTLAEAVGRRFDSIFSRDDPPSDAPPPTKTPVTEKTGESTYLADSPIRDLQSIVLSIEWEITDQLLLRFEKEVTNLADTFRTNPIKVHFLKILQALGKYIKNKKAEAHPGSIKLMAAAFKRFETVVLNHETLFLDKQKLLYKTIQEFQQLKKELTAEAREARQPATPETEISTAESLRAQKPYLEVSRPEVTEQEPKIVHPQAADVVPGSDFVQETVITEEAESRAVQEMMTTQPTEAILEPATEPQVSRPTVDRVQMTPHEAFTLAVEELKNLIRAEFSALRAEIRMWRQGQ